MTHSAFRIAALCVAVLAPVNARSQTTSAGTSEQAPTEPPAATQPAPAQPPARHLNVTWQDGLALESDDGDYRVQIGTFIRFDGRFAPAQSVTVPDTFLLRTLRATFQGRLARYFTFKLQPDFTGAGAPIADAWVDIAFFNGLHVRLGRDKVQIGTETLLQDANVLFLERGLTVNLMPQRDTGIQVYGDLAGGSVSYDAAVFNGQVDGANNNALNTDTDSAKDVSVRLADRPFDRSSVTGLRRLTLVLGASRGQQLNAPVPFFRTSIQQTYFAYARDVVADGTRTRVSPSLSYYVGSFGTYAEYARSRQIVAQKSTSADISNTAWQVTASFLPTHEIAGERIRPHHAFDPENGQWGAVQLTARYGELSVDPEAFSLGLADTASTQHIRVATVGANWYLTTNVKFMLNVERSVFDDARPGARSTEHAVLFRGQLNY